MISVSRLKRAPRRVTGSRQRAARMRARLVMLLEPGRRTAPRTGAVKGVMGRGSVTREWKMEEEGRGKFE
jgi:hypothetical protein